MFEDKDKDERPVEAIGDELCAMAGDLAAAECRWLQLLAEFDVREGWAGPGLRSCAHWLSWRCSLAPGAARERVRVARALVRLPRVVAEFAQGRLSYSKVRALTRVAGPEDEERLVELALSSTAGQLEALVRGYRRVRSLEEAAAQHARRHVSWHWDEDGSLVLRARLSPAEGAAVLAALDAARAAPVAEPEPLDVPAETAEHRSAADALVAVAESYVGTASRAVSGGEVYQVVVHVDESVLTEPTDQRGWVATAESAVPRRCAVDGGGGVAPETARRLACDASIYCLHARGDTPLDVGRRTRTIPPALRRALHYRDGGCRFPGCEQQRRVDGHHIQHWAHGGATRLGNLVLLCRAHHRAVHEGGYRIDVVRYGLIRFYQPDRRLVPAVPNPRTGDGDVTKWTSTAVPPDAITPRWWGDPFDLQAALHAVLAPVAAAPRPPAGVGRTQPALEEAGSCRG